MPPEEALSGKRICLVTSGHLSTNPRLVKEADALAAAGYRVRVVATRYSPWADEFDAGFRGRDWEIAPPVSFGPIAPPSTRLRQLARARTAKALIAAGFATQGLTEYAWHDATPDLAAAALRWPADLYIAHYPAALPATARAAKAHDALYAFDAEDFHLGDPPEGEKHDLLRRMMRKIEGRYLPGCAFVTAASPGIARAYVHAYRIPEPTVLLNVFPRTNGPAAPSRKGSVSPGPSIYWFSQTIGPDRGIENAVKALALAVTRPHLYLRGTISNGFRGTLQELAASSGVAGRVHLLPPAPPDTMEALASAYDLGLVAETGNTPNHRIALANKLFSYLVAGLPVLLSDIEAHREIAPELGNAACLFRTDDAGDLAVAIDGLVSNAGRLAAARAEAHALGQTRFNTDVEMHKLQTLVAHALCN